MIKLFDKSLLTIQDKNGKLNMFALMLPIFFQTIVNNLLSSINTAILSNYDSVIITAMNASTRITSTESALSYFGSAGLAIVLAHALGRNDKDVAENVTTNAICANLILSLVVSVTCLILQEPLLSIFNLEGEMMASARIYFSFQQLSVLMSGVTISLGALLIARGKVAYTVTMNIGLCVLSASGMALLVYTPLGSSLPMIYNVAICSFSVTLIGLIVHAVVVFACKFKMGRKIKLSYIKRLFRIGIPASITTLSAQFSLLLTTSIISMLDVTFINVKVYCDTLFGFVSYLSYSITYAGGIMMGRLVGAGDYERTKRTYRQNFAIVLIANVTFSLIMFFFREPLYTIFDKDASHLLLIAPIFLLDIVVEAGKGVHQANVTSLNAVGDVAYCSVVSIVSCWVCSVFMCYLFAIVLNLGLIGCWIAFIMDEWTRGILCYVRWKSGKWQGKNI